MKIKNTSNTLWNFEINKVLIILFIAASAIGLIVSSQVIKAQADVSVDNKVFMFLFILSLISLIIVCYKNVRTYRSYHG